MHYISHHSMKKCYSNYSKMLPRRRHSKLLLIHSLVVKEGNYKKKKKLCNI